MTNNGCKAIKAVLIYDTETQAAIYAKNYFNDIRVTADLLSGLLHASQEVSLNKHLIKDQVDSIPMDQFSLMINEEGLRINDSNGVHNNVHFHGNGKYSGVMSMGDQVDHTMSNIVYENLVGIIDKHYKGPYGIKESVKDDLDKVLDCYKQVFKEI
jgi:hypothetical protein